MLLYSDTEYTAQICPVRGVFTVVELMEVLTTEYSYEVLGSTHALS
jgi:hypothetical protein